MLCGPHNPAGWKSPVKVITSFRNRLVLQKGAEEEEKSQVAVVTLSSAGCLPPIRSNGKEKEQNKNMNNIIENCFFFDSFV